MVQGAFADFVESLQHDLLPQRVQGSGICELESLLTDNVTLVFRDLEDKLTSTHIFLLFCGYEPCYEKDIY